MICNKIQNKLPRLLKSKNQICCLSRVLQKLLLRICGNGFDLLKMQNIASKKQVMQNTNVLFVSSVFLMDLTAIALKEQLR